MEGWMEWLNLSFLAIYNICIFKTFFFLRKNSAAMSTFAIFSHLSAKLTGAKRRRQCDTVLSVRAACCRGTVARGNGRLQAILSLVGHWFRTGAWKWFSYHQWINISYKILSQTPFCWSGMKSLKMKRVKFHRIAAESPEQRAAGHSRRAGGCSRWLKFVIH